MTAVAAEWVVTWLWQGCLVTTLAGVVLHLARRTNAATRFLAWWITLTAVLTLALVPVPVSVALDEPGGLMALHSAR